MVNEEGRKQGGYTDVVRSPQGTQLPSQSISAKASRVVPQLFRVAVSPKPLRYVSSRRPISTVRRSLAQDSTPVYHIKVDLVCPRRALLCVYGPLLGRKPRKVCTDFCGFVDVALSTPDLLYLVIYNERGLDKEDRLLCEGFSQRSFLGNTTRKSFFFLLQIAAYYIMIYIDTTKYKFGSAWIYSYMKTCCGA